MGVEGQPDETAFYSTLAVPLAALGCILVCVATASAATQLVTHACPEPHVANVSELRAGYVVGAYSEYAADCSGGKSRHRHS